MRFEIITMDLAGNINNLGKKFESTTLLEQRIKSSFLVASVIVRKKKKKKMIANVDHRSYTDPIQAIY